ncbi:hypothetical protein [Streptomyces sp. NPDC003697]
MGAEERLSAARHDGLWVLTSVGRVTAGDEDHLPAVLSNGNPTKEQGIVLVEAAARAAVQACAGDAATPPATASPTG